MHCCPALPCQQIGFLDFLGYILGRWPVVCVRFGLGLTGTQPVFEEIQFLDVGIGSIHSLRLKNRDIISGNITRNVVNVVGTGTHGLTNNDVVYMNVNPGITTTITVKYNKVRRKAVFNPLDYVASGITTNASNGGIRNSITINDHKLKTGDKIIHTSDSPLGLENNREYFVFVVDENTLKFAEVWESEDDFNTYFAKRVERSGEDFARLLVGPPEKECFQTDDWGYGKEWQN